MLDLFFKKTEINRIRILLLFYSHKEVPLQQIQHQTNTPLTTASRLVSDLNTDIQQIFKDDLSIVLENKTYVLDYKKTLNQTEVIGKLGNYYLDSSITFKMMSHIFTEKINNLVQLCADINISQSYVYKKLVHINDTIGAFNIKIVNKQGELSLEGSENSILLLSYAILEAKKKVIPLEDPKINPTIYKYFDPIDNKLTNPYEVRSLSSLYYIVHLRRNTLDQITFKHQDNKEIIETMTDVTNLYNFRQDIKPLNQDSILFLNFMARCCINGAVTFEERVETGRRLALLAENSVVAYACDIVDSIAYPQNRYHLSSQNNYWEAIYLWTFKLCYLDLFKSDILQEFQQFENYHAALIVENRQQKEASKKINYLVASPNFPYSDWCTEQKNSLTLMLKKWAYGLSFSKKEVTFKIMFHFSQFGVANVTIQELILTHFSENFIEFVTSLDEADLLITDVFVVLPDGLQYFLFYDFEEESLYETLLMAIAEASHKKFINLNKKTT